MSKKLTILVLLVFGAGVITSCAKKQVVKPEVTEFKSDADEPSSRGKEFHKIEELGVIYFEYDKSDLTQSARTILKKNAEYLKTNIELEILLEGHCDERGSSEYNMTLGQKRATVVRTYYTQLGVSADRSSTISYGEEKPLDSGHTESAWVKNRRAETLVRNK